MAFKVVSGVLWIHRRDCFYCGVVEVQKQKKKNKNKHLRMTFQLNRDLRHLKLD